MNLTKVIAARAVDLTSSNIYIVLSFTTWTKVVLYVQEGGHCCRAGTV